MDDNYKTYEEYNNEDNDFRQINDEREDSEYFDGEDKKPKLIIIIGGIVLLIIVILIFLLACSKTNKKSDNNYLGSLRVTNGILSPEFEKNTLSYTVSATGDMITVACSSESSKATTDGCNKNVYITDECIEHEVKVIAQDKSERKYVLNICKGDKDAPVIKNVEITPNKYTNGNVKVVIKAESEKPLHEEAYSIDGGLTWQKSNIFSISENKTIEIVVRNKNDVKSLVLNREINNIDKTTPKVSINGSVDSGRQTNSNVELTAIVTPSSTVSGYKYEWYNGNKKISGATSQKYVANSSGTYKVKVTTGAGSSHMSDGYKVVKTSSGSNPKKNDLRITSVTGNPDKWTNKNVVLKVNATSSNGLASSAYSFDGGKTYQKSNAKEFISNQTVTIVVKDSKNYTESYKVYITKIDKTTPTVSITGNRYVGDTLTAKVTPSSTPSGYSFEWYNKDNSIVSRSNTFIPTVAGSYYVKVTTTAGNSKTSSYVSVSNKVYPSINLTSNGGDNYNVNGPITFTATVVNGSAKSSSGYKWYLDSKEYTSCKQSTCKISTAGVHTINVKVVTTSNDYVAESRSILFSIALSPKLTITGTVSSGTPTNNYVTLNVSIENNPGLVNNFKWYKNGSLYSECNSRMKCESLETGKYYVMATVNNSETIKSDEYIVRKINVVLYDPTGGKTVSEPIKLVALNDLKNYYSNVTYTWYKNGYIYSNCDSVYCVVNETGKYTFDVSIPGFRSNRAPEVSLSFKTAEPPKISITAKVKGVAKNIKNSVIYDPVEMIVTATGSSEITDLAFQYLPSDKANDKWYNAGNQLAWYSLEKNGKTATGVVIFYVARNSSGEAILKGEVPFRVRAKDKDGRVTIESYPFTMDFT